MVIVTSGREKGKSGKVLRINGEKNTVTIEKLNLIKRHTRPSQQAPQGNFGPGGGMGGGRGQVSPEEMAKRQTEQLGEFVKFTEGQEEKILEINKKFGEKMTEMRTGRSFRDMSDEERQEMRSKMETIQADRDNEIKALLSEEQLKQYEEYQKEMEQRRMNRMQQRPPQN